MLLDYLYGAACKWFINGLAITGTLIAIIGTLGSGQVAVAQVAEVVVPGRPGRPWSPQVIFPPCRVIPIQPSPVCEMTEIRARISILENVATTTVTVRLKNPSGLRLEAEVLLPVPDGVAVRGFTFQGTGQEPSAELLPREEARRLYESLVNQVRDPALLEFLGLGLVRSSVFPVEPYGEQAVELTYEQLLPRDGDRVDYYLPRSDSLHYRVPFRADVQIQSERKVSTVYSPSHVLAPVQEVGPQKVATHTLGEAALAPGSFRLSYLLQSEDVSATLIAYPDDSVGGGYFLFLGGVPKAPEADGAEPLPPPRQPLDLTIVFDRSGSMRGEKIDQVREATLQVISGLQSGDRFNILVYNEAVESFSRDSVPVDPQNIERARRYVQTILPSGGTNIHDALWEALRQPVNEGALPLVLFLTDGLPTIGKVRESEIRPLATDHNRHSKRIFTFGVGVDVNSPLLENLAFRTRGSATFVLPHEDVEVKVARVFKRLQGPVMSDLVLVISDSQDGEKTTRTTDVLPTPLPDLYSGDQLFILGRYLGDQPLQFQIRGKWYGQEKQLSYTFPLDRASKQHAFVPRLWASRKIAYLIDAIRNAGAEPGRLTPDDPRFQELVEEIVRLSLKFGILTEYTSFLARQGSRLETWHAAESHVGPQLYGRAAGVREGMSAIALEGNNIFRKDQRVLNPRNQYLDNEMRLVQEDRIQQVGDQALIATEHGWLDSRLLDHRESREPITPSRTIAFGTPEYWDVAWQLANEGRQGLLGLRGDVTFLLDEQVVRLKQPNVE